MERKRKRKYMVDKHRDSLRCVIRDSQMHLAGTVSITGGSIADPQRSCGVLLSQHHATWISSPISPVFFGGAPAKERHIVLFCNSTVAADVGQAWVAFTTIIRHGGFNTGESLIALYN